MTVSFQIQINQVEVVATNLKLYIVATMIKLNMPMHFVKM